MLNSSPDIQPSLLGLDPLQGKTFRMRKRDGRLEEFDQARIYRAIEKAFRADRGIAPTASLGAELVEEIARITNSVTQVAIRAALEGDQMEVERIQDEVENAMMAAGHFAIARRYILYREEHKRARALRQDRDVDETVTLYVSKRDGRRQQMDSDRIRREIGIACKGLEDRVDAQEVGNEVLRMVFDGVSTDEINKAMILASRARIEQEPAYTYVAARLLSKVIYREVLGKSCTPDELESEHRKQFRAYLEKGIAADRLHESLLEYDLETIAAALRPERDLKFGYMGMQTIYDRYLLHLNDKRIETPQYFFMRVSMGLAQDEPQREERAIEFYNLLSSFHFMNSTPTLFNAGTMRPQLSSCYLSTVMDDLEHIFKVVGDDARLSKWAGGLGNDWTNVRATGGYIKGTNGRSQGVVPFLKVANDTAVAVNQGGKRKGAMCAYLETWHLDIEDFLELRKNTGDERRRTHDMNTANWIPDLFMKRVAEGGQWTLFNPCEVPDLHDLFGAAFEARYKEYEAMADAGKLKQHKRSDATNLWRKMLSMLFETGHPWITFKDPSNVRSPQDHTGVVHSSNLCTEILLNTSEHETAVCNLGSINLAQHVIDGKLNEKLLARTVRTALRMLDNVIDINYYPTPEAKTANMRHRPVGMGIMGFQDALYRMDISYASEEAVEFADRSMEMISYYAILASTELAAERGTYQTYAGSKWSRGILPIDSIELLSRERGAQYLEMDSSSSMDWERVREAVRTHGMRNSNTMAIAPTATISNIVGVSQSIEPTYSNLFSKSNLSGDFAVVNTYMVEDLKSFELWDAELVDDLKYFDGSLAEIERIPQHLRDKYRTAFEIEPKWLVECASRRQKWIDMGQSLNLYIREPSGRKLSEMYQFAWRRGLKTTYYLRGLAATQIEKSTVDVNRRGIQPRWMKNRSASADVQVHRTPAAGAPEAEPMGDDEALVQNPATAAPTACSLLDPECEACQ